MLIHDMFSVNISLAGKHEHNLTRVGISKIDNSALCELVLDWSNIVCDYYMMTS